MMLRKSPFRTLCVVYLLAILAGFYEGVTKSTHSQPDPDIFGDPVRNFPEAMARLYPGTPEAEYLTGRRIEAIAGERAARKRGSQPLSDVISEMNVDLRVAANHYERAIQMGLKSEENLYYNYALTLIRIQAEPAQIDRAIADFKRYFPHSSRRDLRQRRRLIEEELRQLPSLSQTTNETNGDVRQSSPSAADLTKVALEFVPEWKPNPGYVGSQACQTCHPQQFDGYQETTHAHALTEIRPTGEPPDAVFDHLLSGRRYRMSHDENSLTIDESLPLDDGTEFPLTSTPVRYRVGSGHFARTYLRDVGGGFLFESPVTWYESPHAWKMTPGFDKPTQRSFSRQILENCLSCHCGQVSLSTDSSFRLRIVENSIGCERCHGPGESHIAYRNSAPSVTAADDPIVNPQRLARARAESVCQQCHLQGDIRVEGPGHRAGEYRPGQALEEFSMHYRVHKAETGMTVVGHGEQLEGSPCYRKSDSLTCITCHDPHRSIAPNKRVEHYRSACLKCHTDQGCRLDLSTRLEKSQNDCVQCHMPKSATEVPHLAFTHHHIGIHPLHTESGSTDDELLIALSDLSGLSTLDRERSLKLARLQMLLIRGPDFMGSARGRPVVMEINQWLRNLPPDRLDAETEFLKSQFLFATGDQHTAERLVAHLLTRADLRTEEEAAIREQSGRLAFQRGRFAEAREQFGRLARLRCQGRDWYFLGLSEERCGNLSDALRALERALELEPAAVETYEALARIHKAQNHVSEEQRLRTRILQLKRGLPKPPTNP
ncbi:MAG: hypothetical protein JSS49_15660 [Planctomycetes bacterium]|nr:hypothetical protein [Planctomycetota bacterium]